MKKGLLILLVLLMCVTSVFGFASCAKNETVYFTIGTAGTAGALYPMGVAMAQTITDHVEGFAATGESTAASIANIKGLKDGSFGWAISQTEVASLAYYGKGGYEGNAVPELRALFSTIYNYLQVFTLEGKGIDTFEDFKGKTIGVGAAGSGGAMMAEVLLDCYDMTLDDVHAQYMSESDAVAALKDGKIDGFICTHPLNSAALTELVTSANAKMINIDNDKFYETIPAYTKFTVPAGTYEGIDYDVVTPKARIIMLTTKDAFTEEQIYEMVKAIWENREEWAGCAKSVSEQVILETALQEIDIPLHKGAIRYFEEIGLTVPENLIAPND